MTPPPHGPLLTPLLSFVVSKLEPVQTTVSHLQAFFREKMSLKSKEGKGQRVSLFSFFF
jgi:hypothetical protein